MADQPLNALDEARAREAQRRCWMNTFPWDGLQPWVQSALILAARLAREGWEPVDPLLLRARALCADQLGTGTAAEYLSGKLDTHYHVKLALAALKQNLSMGGAEP